jgi:hypothetical protein
MSTNENEAMSTPKQRQLEIQQRASGSGIVEKREPATMSHLGGELASSSSLGANFTDHNGSVITMAHVQLIFWGSAWSGNPTPSATDITNAVTRILSSSYMSALSQYRGIGAATLRGTLLVTSSNPPNPFSNSSVENLIRDLLQAGTLPEPDDDAQILYCVIMPVGVNSEEYTNNGTIGEHSYFVYFDVDFPVPQVVKARYAWVMNDGTLDYVTNIFSHELVEACSDPEGSAILGDTGTCSASGWCEIGDVCQDSSATVKGVLVQSYWSQSARACVVPGAFQLTAHGGFLVQSTSGTKGNFELVVPYSTGGLAHYWRNNDDPNLPWIGPTIIGQSVGQVDAVSLIQSNYGNPGNLEVLARVGNQLVFFERESEYPFTWTGPSPILPNVSVSGNPALIQSRSGRRGNFELVVPLASGGLIHFSRSNDDSNSLWGETATFGQAAGLIDAVALIQSNYGNPGNLEVLARVGNQLVFFERESEYPFTWTGPSYILPNVSVSGNPALIQSRFGHTGNFELVVPLASGGLAHFWRNNDDPNLPWMGPTAFGSAQVDALSLIQSNYGTPGNLEVVAHRSLSTAGPPEWDHFQRDSASPFAWSSPQLIANF